MTIESMHNEERIFTPSKKIQEKSNYFRNEQL